MTLFVNVLLYDVKVVIILLLVKPFVIFLLLFFQKVFPTPQKIKEKHHLSTKGDFP
jgi:hypothetical protein